MRVIDLHSSVATQTRLQKATTPVWWRQVSQEARRRRPTARPWCRHTSLSSRHVRGRTWELAERLMDLVFLVAARRLSWLLRDDKGAAVIQMLIAKPQRDAMTSRISMKVRCFHLTRVLTALTVARRICQAVHCVLQLLLSRSNLSPTYVRSSFAAQHRNRDNSTYCGRMQIFHTIPLSYVIDEDPPIGISTYTVSQQK